MPRQCRTTLILLICALLLVLASCGKKAPADPEPPEPDPIEVVEPLPPPDPVPVVPTRPNPLTGLQMAEDYDLSRPVAIMIGNSREALPTRGLTRVDAAFEVLAEGAINRIIAVYYDYRNNPAIGTVRSARDYFFKLVLPLEPHIIHYGASPAAYTYVKQNRLDNMNGIDGMIDGVLFWRDRTRGKQGSEHTVFTSSIRIENAMTRFDRNRELSNKDLRFRFRDDPIEPGVLPASKITVPYSSYITAEFEYDGDKQTYLRSQYGEPHMDDGNLRDRVSADNVFVLYVPHRATGDEAGRIVVDVVGSGSGLYFSQGKGVPIKWSKKDDRSFYTFTHEDGTQLALNRGNMWFCIVRPNTKVTHE